MLKKITLIKNFCHYFPKTRQRVFELSDGWNTFVGDNGTGKTTILNCLDSGLDITTLDDGVNQRYLNSVPAMHFEVEADGDTRIIRYDPEYVYQKNSIKDDFDLGIINHEDFARFTLFRESRGQDAVWYFKHFLKLYREELYDRSSDIVVLIDEPENSLSLINQAYFYKTLRTWADQEHIQIICASHSPLLMHKFSDKVFELSNNYIKRTDKELFKLFK